MTALELPARSVDVMNKENGLLQGHLPAATTNSDQVPDFTWKLLGNAVAGLRSNLQMQAVHAGQALHVRHGRRQMSGYL